MELLLDRTNYFIGFSTDFLNVLHFCRPAKAKLPHEHWTLISIDSSRLRFSTVELYLCLLSRHVYHQLLHVSLCVYSM